MASSARAAIRRFHNRLCVAAMIGLAVGLLGFGLLASPAGAQDDDFDPASDSRVVRLDATYIVLPDEELIDVVEIIRVSNVKASTSQYYYFWTGHDIRVPVDAQDLSITSNGRDLPFIEAGTNEVLRYGTIEFPSNLLFGQSRTLEVRYQLSSDRSADGQVRVNTAIFNGYTVTCCDFEDVDIKLIAPLDFEITPDAEFTYERTVADGMQTFQYTATELESGFTEAVVTEWSGINEDGFVREDLRLGGSTLQLIAAPDDPVWQRNLKRLVPELGDALTDLVGDNWLEDDLDFRAGPNPVFGDDGWVNVDDSLIVIPIGYSDAAVALTLARRAAPELQLRMDDVRAGATRLLASEVLDAAVSSERLNSLRPGGGVIRSGHNAHWFVEQLGGPDGWAGLVELAEFANSETTTWPGPDGAEDLSTLRADWRRIVDVADALDRPEAITAIETFQLDEGEQAELAEHGERVEQMLGLAELTDRPAPIGIRRALTNWELDRTDDLITSADSTLTARAALIEAADGASLEVDTDLATAWDGVEDESDFADLSSQYEDRTAIIGRLVDARAEVGSERGFVEGLGFDQPAADAQLAAAATAIEEDRLGDAETALDATDELVADASSAGQRTLGMWIAIVVGALVVLGLAFWFWRRSRRKKNATDHEAASPSMPPTDSGRELSGVAATASAAAAAEPIIDLRTETPDSAGPTED